MKLALQQVKLPENSLLLLCSSQEDRCLGALVEVCTSLPKSAILFYYDTMSTAGKRNHTTMASSLAEQTEVIEAPLSEILSGGPKSELLASALRNHGDDPLVVDISVMSKAHVFVLLQWLDDHGYWDHLWILYSEPGQYGTEHHIPLSFGVASINHLPGFTSAANPSRPLHAVLFLGYEGDRALATYEFLQPTKTSVIIPDPPFQSSWIGRTEAQNKNLIATIGNRSSFAKVDALDPASTYDSLRDILGDVNVRSDFSRALCPFGTKPQVLGSYTYLRECEDPPAVIYTKVLRHNDHYYSKGIGNKWLVRRPR